MSHQWLNISKTRWTLCLGLGLVLANAARGEDVRTVRLSKTELQQMKPGQFIRATDLSDVLSNHAKNIIISVTQRQAGNNVATRDAMTIGSEPSKKIWMKRLSTLAVDPDQIAPRGNSTAVRNALTSQSRKTVEMKIKDSLPIVQQFKKGLSFNLNLSNPVGSLPSEQELPVIRYGLVEADILPAERSIPVATLGEISDIDTRYSSPAKVVYTIDRISGERGKPVFTGSVIEDQTVQNSSIWRKAPSTDLKVKIDAADKDASMSEKLGQGAMPAARISIAQADGLVTTKMIADGKSNAQKTLTTEFKAPLYGEMSLAQTYDYQMKLTQTSALNLLGNSSLPRFNLLYAHNTKKAKGEWIMRSGNFEYALIAEPHQGWSPGSKGLGRPGDKLSLSLNSRF